MAWADARGVAVPGHVRPAVAARAKSPPKSECAECAKARATPRWVSGAAHQKCRKAGPGAPAESRELFAAWPATPGPLAPTPQAFERAPDADSHLPPRVPPTTPPRAA